MSNIDKRALREAAERAESDSWGYDRDEFNEALTPSTVLALLDELEAKDSMIAAQQHEIRTLLNALEGRPCPKCNDTGMADSGGTQPWGEPISVPCDCAAPPSPVAVPEGYRLQPISEYDAMCAAMLQGAEQQNRQQNIPENIPATQFKPVADLYGLTSPTGSETSFTFDAVEARDFIDGGWSCQEYVELGRYQEALTDHSEDKLAMVDHSGDSNNMVEPVTTAYKLPPHIFRELVNRLRDTAVKYQGCQQLREQLSRTLQEVIQPAAPQQEVT